MNTVGRNKIQMITTVHLGGVIFENNFGKCHVVQYEYMGNKTCPV